jgi:hypothetical protein
MKRHFDHDKQCTNPVQTIPHCTIRVPGATGSRPGPMAHAGDA